MEEAESRFQHLLQPIRDLTKNWEVDVAAQLEEYLEEVRGGPRIPCAGELGGDARQPC
uniref:Condensin-2 complex subunit H2 n=1 Tax=Bubo bubo TaxID=30461 RepID=A0A8C0FV04_BUBBB